MFRSHTCGELRLADAGKTVTLSGWVQRTRKMGGMTFVDLRDRYGITQLVFNTEINAELCEQANHLGREFVIQVTGEVNERSNKNFNIPTGEIEITVSDMNILNSALTPPFTIEDNSDGGDDIRMKYRYLDLRRPDLQKNICGNIFSDVVEAVHHIILVVRITQNLIQLPCEVAMSVHQQIRSQFHVASLDRTMDLSGQEHGLSAVA